MILNISAGGTTNFITGAGGFLQAVWAGYGGVRITEQGFSFNLQLPDGTNFLKLRGFQYLSSWIDICYFFFFFFHKYIFLENSF